MDVNRVTLECLVNPTLYNKYLKKNEKEMDNLDFYKKRIIDLTNKLLENKTENNALNKAFNNYIYECISHLYEYDMNKTYQKEYLDISFNTDISKNILFDNSSIDLTNVDNYIIKKKEENKITNYIKKNKSKPKKKYPVKKHFDPKDVKFKEP
tara:strand:+ start:2586 stop:3044 length:459 start_codon:yes stop_codon:yes gene_type:complete